MVNDFNLAPAGSASRASAFRSFSPLDGKYACSDPRMKRRKFLFDFLSVERNRRATDPEKSRPFFPRRCTTGVRTASTSNSN